MKNALETINNVCFMNVNDTLSLEDYKTIVEALIVLNREIDHLNKVHEELIQMFDDNGYKELSFELRHIQHLINNK